MRKDIVFAIIVYNEYIKDSIAYQSIEHDNIIIYDNSDCGDYNKCNQEYCQSHDITYLTSCQNIGNSKAYNQIFDYLQDLDYQWLVLCDDDTYYTQDYLTDLEHLSAEYDFYLPQIMSSEQEKIIFPIQKTKDKAYVGKYEVKDVLKVESINSGLVLHKRVFTKFRYDEEYFVYCSDFDFIQLLVDNHLSYKIMDSIITQHFFDHQTTFSDSTIRQMDIFLADKAKQLDYHDFLNFRYFYVLSKFQRFKKIKILPLLFKKYKGRD